MRHKAIDQDLSWLKPARKWEAVLEALATGSTQAQERALGVLTPVQTPEHVARSEKSEALREEAKVMLLCCKKNKVCFSAVCAWLKPVSFSSLSQRKRLFLSPLPGSEAMRVCM